DAPEQLTGPLFVPAEMPPVRRLGSGPSGRVGRRVAASVVARRWAVVAAAAGAVLVAGSLLVAARREVPLEIASAPAPSPASLVLTSGEVELQGTPGVLAGTTLRAGDVLQVGVGRACIHVSASLVCLGDGAKLTLNASTAEEQVLLL